MHPIEVDVKARVKASFNRAMNHFYTANHYLNDTIVKSRNAALLRQLESAQTTYPPSTTLAVPLDTIRQAIESTTYLSIQEYTAQELSIVINAYTKVCSKILIDEIPQIIECYYVQKVCEIELLDENCSDAMLAKLLSPEPLVIARRSRIEADIKNLTQAEEKAMSIFA